MKNKVFYMSMLLMCIMTSCSDDNAPPIPAPTLSFDDNDKALAPGAYDTHSSAYTYTAEKTKADF